VLGHAARPHLVDVLLRQLAGLADRPDFAALATALQRARRIVPPGQPAGFDPVLLSEPSSQRLVAVLESVSAALDERVDLERFTATAAPLGQAVADFFDEVLVMTDDAALRGARLGLLAAVRDLGERQLDWAELRP
jgi:glycyl-tRNA synthetase